MKLHYLDLNYSTFAHILNQLKELGIDPADATLEVDSYQEYDSMGGSCARSDLVINVPEAKYGHLKGK